jgi:hypothetical protein
MHSERCGMTTPLRIKNWSEFQHFKDRSPPWIKLHRHILEQRDITMISDCSFRVLVGLWLLASEDKEMMGTLPPVDDIAFRLRLEKSIITKALQELGPWLDGGDITMISPRYQGDVPEERRGEVEKEVKERCCAFDAFWLQYPNKKSKKKARAIYEGVVSRGEATHEVLLGAVIKYAASDEVMRGYAKHPTTWLNGGCWDDEPTPAKKQTSPIMEAIDRI